MSLQIRRGTEAQRSPSPGNGVVFDLGELIYTTDSKKLYVGNLAYSVTNAELEKMFTVYGAVESAEVISDRGTGRSKGFGFVEMQSDAEAQEAINALNGKSMGGRPLTVNEARPREERSGGGGGGGYRGGGGGGGW